MIQQILAILAKLSRASRRYVAVKSDQPGPPFAARVAQVS